MSLHPDAEPLVLDETEGGLYLCPLFPLFRFTPTRADNHRVIFQSADSGEIYWRCVAAHWTQITDEEPTPPEQQQQKKNTR